MSFFLEGLFLALGLGWGVGALMATTAQPRFNRIARYLLAVFAWIPIWLFWYALWGLTGHLAHDLPGWASLVFWISFLLGIMLMVFAFLNRRTLVLVKVAGAVAVLAECFHLTWFAPDGLWSWDTLWLALGLVIGLVVARMVFARMGLAAALLVLLVLFLGFGSPVQEYAQSHFGNSGAATDAVTPGSSTSSTTTVTVSPTAPPVNANDLANQLFGAGKPFEGMQDKVGVGTNQVDWSMYQHDPGVSSYTNQAIKSQSDLSAFLNGSSEASKQAKHRVQAAVQPFGQHEVDRALNGSGYFPIQAKVASQMLGNSYFKEGKVLVDGEWRNIKAGDVFWVFMTENGTIVWEATVRADCGNLHLTKVRPQPQPAAAVPAPSASSVPAAPPSSPTTTLTTPTTCAVCITKPPPSTTTTPPKTCESVYGPGYTGNYPDCHKSAVNPTGGSVIPPPPTSAPGTNPPPATVTRSTTSSGTTTPTVEPTASQCYDPSTGQPVPAGTPGAWC